MFSQEQLIAAKKWFVVNTDPKGGRGGDGEEHNLKRKKENGIRERQIIYRNRQREGNISQPPT